MSEIKINTPADLIAGAMGVVAGSTTVATSVLEGMFAGSNASVLSGIASLMPKSTPEEHLQAMKLLAISLANRQSSKFNDSGTLMGADADGLRTDNVEQCDGVSTMFAASEIDGSVESFTSQLDDSLDVALTASATLGLAKGERFAKTFHQRAVQNSVVTFETRTQSTRPIGNPTSSAVPLIDTLLDQTVLTENANSSKLIPSKDISGSPVIVDGVFPLGNYSDVGKATKCSGYTGTLDHTDVLSTIVSVEAVCADVTFTVGGGSAVTKSIQLSVPANYRMLYRNQQGSTAKRSRFSVFKSILTNTAENAEFFTGVGLADDTLMVPAQFSANVDCKNRTMDLDGKVRTDFTGLPENVSIEGVIVTGLIIDLRYALDNQRRNVLMVDSDTEKYRYELSPLSPITAQSSIFNKSTKVAEGVIQGMTALGSTETNSRAFTTLNRILTGVAGDNLAKDIDPTYDAQKFASFGRARPTVETVELKLADTYVLTDKDQPEAVCARAVNTITGVITDMRSKGLAEVDMGADKVRYVLYASGPVINAAFRFAGITKANGVYDLGNNVELEVNEVISEQIGNAAYLGMKTSGSNDNLVMNLAVMCTSGSGLYKYQGTTGGASNVTVLVQRNGLVITCPVAAIINVTGMRERAYTPAKSPVAEGAGN